MIIAGAFSEFATAIDGVFIGPGTIYLLVANRSAADVAYSQSDLEVFYPQDVRLPPLTLAALAADTAVPAGTQGLLQFTHDFDVAALGLNNDEVIPYFSQPRAALTEGAGGDCPGGINALGNDCIPVVAAEPGNGENPGVGGASSGDSNARDLAVIGLGVGVVGFMAAYLSGGDFSLFNFAPNIGYSLTESGYSVNAGGRLNFRKDNWHLYYAAGQANSNGEFGDFRYESGGEYSADLWTAAFSETVQGETADYDFSLSADYKGGIWKVSPTYRLHSHFADEEFDTQNSLNLHGELLWNRWTIRPSAGFRWESADEFGDNTRFNLSAVRRF
ncbi:MAG: hypothetical protein ACR2QC_07390 [Gammaproteobacteria bacterium]